MIAGPSAGTTSDYDAPAPNGVYAGAIGDCVEDTFTLTAPGMSAPPLICGFNTGQHSESLLLLLFMLRHFKMVKNENNLFSVIVDASDECHEATFHIGGNSTFTRQWNIKGVEKY